MLPLACKDPHLARSSGANSLTVLCCCAFCGVWLFSRNRNSFGWRWQFSSKSGTCWISRAENAYSFWSLVHRYWTSLGTTRSRSRALHMSCLTCMHWCTSCRVGVCTQARELQNEHATTKLSECTSRQRNKRSINERYTNLSIPWLHSCPASFCYGEQLLHHCLLISWLHLSPEKLLLVRGGTL